MRDQATALGQEVLKLRAQGFPYRKIAAKLGISKSYAAKLTRSGHSERLVTGHTCLSVRERKFALGLIEGKSQHQAALDAGVPRAGADSWASRTRRDPRFQESLHNLLEQAGLGEQQLVQALAKLVNATKVVGIARLDGKITDRLEVPDYAVQLRAAELGFRLWGRLGPQKGKQAAGGGGGIVFHLVPDKKGPHEDVTGVPLPGTTAADS